MRSPPLCGARSSIKIRSQTTSPGHGAPRAASAGRRLRGCGEVGSPLSLPEVPQVPPGSRPQHPSLHRTSCPSFTSAPDVPGLREDMAAVCIDPHGSPNIETGSPKPSVGVVWLSFQPWEALRLLARQEGGRRQRQTPEAESRSGGRGPAQHHALLPRRGLASFAR